MPVLKKHDKSHFVRARGDSKRISWYHYRTFCNGNQNGFPDNPRLLYQSKTPEDDKHRARRKDYKGSGRWNDMKYLGEAIGNYIFFLTLTITRKNGVGEFLWENTSKLEGEDK